MLLGLFTVKESPRWLATRGRTQEALVNLAYLRKRSETSDEVTHEMAEIEAAIEEERIAREGLGWREAFTGKGNSIRFVIAFVIFLLQQWGGQNSVGYYAPQIFASVSSKLSYTSSITLIFISYSDRLHWDQELSACLRYLRCRQGRRYRYLHLLRCGDARS